MTFIVETGAGTPGANANCTVAFVTQYLTDRGRETENGWSTSTTAQQQEAIVVATDFMERRYGLRVRGRKLRTHIEGRAASGLLSFTGLPSVNDTLVVGQKTYRLVAALTQENDVLIGATIAETVANLVLAINGSGGFDTVVEEHTLPNYEVFAIDQSPDLAISAQIEGESGNEVAFSKSMANTTISGSGFLTDGLDEGEQPLSFPRYALRSRDGVQVVGVPLKWKQATAELAVRARSSTSVLLPDPTVDASLVPIQSKREKVGPIEEETQFVIGAQARMAPAYPAADLLVQEYLESSGGCIRG